MGGWLLMPSQFIRCGTNATLQLPHSPAVTIIRGNGKWFRSFGSTVVLVIDALFFCNILYHGCIVEEINIPFIAYHDIRPYWSWKAARMGRRPSSRSLPCTRNPRRPLPQLGANFYWPRFSVFGFIRGLCTQSVLHSHRVRFTALFHSAFLMLLENRPQNWYTQ